MSNQNSLIEQRVLARVKLKQLRLLDAVVKHKSIKRAAQQMRLSQPAASKLIKDLEDDFEIRLFERTNRGVIPTIYCDVLLQHGNLVLRQISQAARELQDLRNGSAGRVVVGTLLAASALLLPRTVKNVVTTNPLMSIRITEGTHEYLMPALRSGELDLVVGRLPSHRYRDELQQEKLYDEQIVAVTRIGHPLQKKKRTSFEKLMKFTWILPPPDTTLRRQIDVVFLDRNFSAPQNVIESVSYLANREMLATSDMIGLLPVHVANQDIEAGTLVLLPWQPPIPISPIGVSYRKAQALSPAGRLFLQELRSVAEAFRIAGIA